jgi:hypothetical protein
MRGRTVLTTRGFYDRLPGFDSRNVAVNNPKTPSPAITFPITAIINFFLDGKNAATPARVLANFRRAGEASPTIGTPPRPG